MDQLLDLGRKNIENAVEGIRVHTFLSILRLDILGGKAQSRRSVRHDDRAVTLLGHNGSCFACSASQTRGGIADDGCHALRIRVLTGTDRSQLLDRKIRKIF